MCSSVAIGYWETVSAEVIANERTLWEIWFETILV